MQLRFRKNLTDIINLMLFVFISSNINGVTRGVNFTTTKSKHIKIKNAPKKHIRGKQSLIRLFAFLYFYPSVFVPFSAFGAFCACQIFS